MRIVLMFAAALAAAVGIGLGAAAAADDTPTNCVNAGGTVICPKDG
jgi:hypothetical protein